MEISNHPTDETTMEAATIPELHDQILHLRAALRVVTDCLDELLEAGRFPPKGRSIDDKDSMIGWWEDRHNAVAHARAVLEQSK